MNGIRRQGNKENTKGPAGRGFLIFRFGLGAGGASCFRRAGSNCKVKAVSIVRLICRGFMPEVVQLQSQKRQALQVNDEYDVQDILHALLELHFNNVCAEQQGRRLAASCRGRTSC
ncbi:MAG: hypothetical protein DMG69_31340 [Acidobacteria bacterium]|nr:MAG: hypothetical protein DMG69_31340 [Acidobacteriota bacterium]